MLKTRKERLIASFLEEHAAKFNRVKVKTKCRNAIRGEKSIGGGEHGSSSESAACDSTRIGISSLKKGRSKKMKE